MAAELIPSIIGDVLGGLITGLGNLVNSFFNDVNFITRTPEALTYRNQLVQQFAGASQVLANGLLAVVTLTTGFNLMLRPYFGSKFAGVAEILPRLLLGAILINTAAWWCQLAIDVNNAACGVFGDGPPPNLVDVLLHFTLPFELLIELIYVVMGLLLVVQQLMRLGLIDVLLILAPLAALCWILPQTQAWGRRWAALEEWRSAAASARGRFRPDGYGCYRRGRFRFGFLLEYDRGTERSGQYAAKLAAYYHYRDSSQSKRDYDGIPSLLVVTTSDAAEDRFAYQAYLAGQGRGGAPLPAFLTTTRRIRTHAEGILGPIWCTPGPYPPANGRTRHHWLPSIGSRGLGRHGYAATEPWSEWEAE